MSNTTPTAGKCYWFRRTPEDEWELCRIKETKRFVARFFDGEIWDDPSGEWIEATPPGDLRAALEESVKLQSHYAELLNMHDGGQRMCFDDADAWLERLREVADG